MLRTAGSCLKSCFEGLCCGNNLGGGGGGGEGVLNQVAQSIWRLFWEVLTDMCLTPNSASNLRPSACLINYMVLAGFPLFMENGDSRLWISPKAGSPSLQVQVRGHEVDVSSINDALSSDSYSLSPGAL